MRWSEKEPRRGDMVRVQVRFYYHYGIFVDENTIIQFGLPDNSNIPPEEICVIATDAATFLNGGFLECGEPSDAEEKRKQRKAEEVVTMAQSHLGEKGYHILHNNCEHFAYNCMFGEKKSFLDDVRAKIRKKLKEAE